MPLPFEKNIKNAMFILVERVMYFVSVHLEILKKFLGLAFFFSLSVMVIKPQIFFRKTFQSDISEAQKIPHTNITYF